MESLADNKWLEALKSRALGASSSRPPTTVRPKSLDGEKVADNAVVGS